MATTNINQGSGRYCTGCGVCSTVCPRDAISVGLNLKGFLEASADDGLCIDCGKCVDVCSKYAGSGDVSYLDLIKEKGRVYMAFSRNDSARHISSSGGIGPEISKKFLALGYTICGACYDAKNSRVEHWLAHTEDELTGFIGSKYLQSFTTKAFSGLVPDRKYVIFGTPCQIYALRRKARLEKIEQNVLLIDFFCHGVPSCLLWNNYIEYVKKSRKTGEVKAVSFRDKKHGWHDYSMTIEGNHKNYTGRKHKDLFYHFYLSNVCLNEECYQCSLRLGNVYSDIRLGDFWGKKYGQDKKGISLVTVNTEKGFEALEFIKNNIILEEAEAEDLLEAQPVRRIAVPEKREAVMEALKAGKSLWNIYWRYMMAEHVRSRLMRFIMGLVPGNVRSLAKRMIK